MGTGVGEAMLLGAAMGGGSAAITGGDPLKGALLGGLTGGVGSGLPSILGAGAGGAEAGLLSGGAGGAGGAGLGLQAGSSLGLQAAPGALGAASTSSGLAGLGGAVDYGLASNALGSTAANAANAAGMAGGTGLVPPTSTLSSAPSLFQDPLKYLKAHPFLAGSAALAGATGARRQMQLPEKYTGPLSQFSYDPSLYRPTLMADGGIASLGRQDMTVGGGPPRTPPIGDGTAGVLDWQQRSEPVRRMASGGISDLGSYSDGGRMLRGPGDGMSDNIPGVIAGKRPARLADGEFVVPADVVSHLGNGSTDAGAKQLYSMMDRVREARTGTRKQGRQIKPGKLMPA